MPPRCSACFAPNILITVFQTFRNLGVQWTPTHPPPHPTASILLHSLSHTPTHPTMPPSVSLRDAFQSELQPSGSISEAIPHQGWPRRNSSYFQREGARASLRPQFCEFLRAPRPVLRLVFQGFLSGSPLSFHLLKPLSQDKVVGSQSTQYERFLGVHITAETTLALPLLPSTQHFVTTWVSRTPSEAQNCCFQRLIATIFGT